MQHGEVIHDEVVGKPPVETSFRLKGVPALYEGLHGVDGLSELEGGHIFERRGEVSGDVLAAIVYDLGESRAQLGRFLVDIGVFPDFDVLKDERES